MTYPLVRELAADGIAVATTCRVLKFTPQGFYKWLKRPYSDRDWDDAHLINAILDIHNDDPEFGYRFITDELERAGWAVSENRVQRLCQDNKIWSVTVKKSRKNTKPGPPVHDDLLERDFSVKGPNQAWVGDITEHRTDEGKLYLCTFKDLWSNRIVGYPIADRMTAELAVAAITNAAALRDMAFAGVIVHTDRGSQDGFNWSSQHLDEEVVDGQASWVDDGVDWAVADEVAGRASASARDRVRVLETGSDRDHERGCC